MSSKRELPCGSLSCPNLAPGAMSLLEAAEQRKAKLAALKKRKTLHDSNGTAEAADGGDGHDK